MLHWVHHCEKRRGRIQATLDSLDESDIGEYEVRLSPPGSITEQNEWWMERLLEYSGMCDWFVRFEDDVLVNRHIAENVEKWRAREDPRFGVGLLFYPDTYKSNRDPVTNEYGSHVVTMWGALGVVFRSEVVPTIVEELRKRPTHPKVVMFDGCLQRAVLRCELRTYVHLPSLVTGAQLSHESAWRGIAGRHNGLGFDADWRHPGH